MDTAQSDRRGSLRSLFVLPLPLALFAFTIGYPLAVLLFDMRVNQRDVALSVALGAVVGALMGSAVWLTGRRLLAICVGILACSISIVAYVVLGLGIPLEWIIR